MSKQNTNLISNQQNQPCQSALITLFILYNQHITDQAKHLYNQTVLRALKQEYETLNDEKNELIDTYESTIKELKEKIQQANNESKMIEEDDASQDEINQFEEIIEGKHLPKTTIDNETQTDDQHYDKVVQLNHKLKKAFQNMKEKINRFVNEKPHLFLETNDEIMERLDQLISTFKTQISQHECDQQKITELLR